MQDTDITMKNALKDDRIFNKINKEFLSLDSDDVRSNNQSLSKIFDKLIEAMRRENPLFSKIFQRIIWAGSYYKKTRIEEPKEYDINLVIDLRIKEKDLQFIPDCPGYTKIRTKVSPSDINLDIKTYKELQSFIDEDSYLNQEKIRKWMEGILSKVACATSGNNQYIQLDTYYKITIKKSGPAFTLSVPLPNGEIDIDLVPVLAFSISNPPPGYSQKLFSIYKNSQKYNNKCWSVVPKPLSNNRGEFPDKQHRYWRLCFYEVEKDILSNKIYERAKPIIRHLKKLRDTQNWKNIASYYIETLCLHHLKILENSDKSLTFLFFKMLQKLCDAFREGCIKYYWNDELNLLEKMDKNEIKNIENRLNKIIKKIEETVNNNKFVIAEFILNKNECDKLKTMLNTTTRSATADQDQMQTEPSKEWGCMIA